MDSRLKRLMKFLKDNIGYCVYTFMVDKDLKKTINTNHKNKNC